jgi:hypothetical protein
MKTFALGRLLGRHMRCHRALHAGSGRVKFTNEIFPGDEMKSRLLLLTSCGLTALASTAALAADLVVNDAMYYPYPISGYVEAFGGLDAGEQSGSYADPFPAFSTYDEDFQGMAFGAAGHVAMRFAPDFSAQGDAWLSGWFGQVSGDDTGDGPYEYDYDNIYAGVGGHLSWRPAEHQLLGVFGSLGMISARDFDTGTHGTVGVEGAIGDEMWRAYGQAGFSAGLTDYPADVNSQTLFARGLFAYYLDENLSVSGNLGISRSTSDDNGGLTYEDLTWGARLDYKPDNLPFTAFLAYQGWSWSGEDEYPSDWNGTEHAVVAGLRIPFGVDDTTTLRAMDDEVGLYDMNPVYGRDFVR